MPITKNKRTADTEQKKMRHSHYQNKKKNTQKKNQRVR